MQYAKVGDETSPLSSSILPDSTISIALQSPVEDEEHKPDAMEGR
jgi:hypothetical protein